MKQIVVITAILAAIVLLGGCSALISFLTGNKNESPGQERSQPVF